MNTILMQQQKGRATLQPADFVSRVLHTFLNDQALIQELAQLAARVVSEGNLMKIKFLSDRAAAKIDRAIVALSNRLADEFWRCEPCGDHATIAGARAHRARASLH